MSGFDVERDAHSLTLTRRASVAQWWRSCGLMAGSAAVVSVLGVLAMVREAAPEEGRASHELVWLWLIGVVAIAVLIPAYASRVLISPTVIRFDRAAGMMTQRGRTVTALNRIERLRVRRTVDTDGRDVFTLDVLHTDGCEHPIERTYDEVDVWILGHEVADFLGVEISQA